MDRRPYPGTPRWVKVAGLFALAFIAAFAILHLAGGGFRHHAPLSGDHAPAEPESSRQP